MIKIKFIDIDMDEVLVDFIGGACKAHGVTREEMEFHRKPGEWAINEPMGKALGIERSLTDEEFWKPINEQGEHFWLTLEPLPWIDDIIKLVEETKLEWYVVTTPSHDFNSYSGKVRWLKNKFGNSFDRMFLTSHKHRLVNQSLLIDDRESNLETFVYHGGVPILFPSLGNSYYLFHKDPLFSVSRDLSYRGLL